MVKSKKGKKNQIRGDEEMDSDVDVQETQLQDSDGESIVSESAASNKNKSKKKGNAADMDTETLAKNLKNVKLNESDDEEDDEPKSKPKKGGKKGATKPNFALLEVESGGDSDGGDEPPPESDEDMKPVKKQPVKKENSLEDDVKVTGKKSKKTKKKRNDSDEDIDKVLAELEMEYTGVKVERTTETETTSSKADKKGKNVKKEPVPVDQDGAGGDDEDGDEDGGGGTVKSAAQKKKEKKERQKREAALLKQQAKESGVSEAVLKKEKEAPAKPRKVSEKQEDDEPTVVEEPAEKEEDGDTKGKSKKKKDKKLTAEEKKKEEEKTRKGPSKGVVAAMQEHLRKMKEEEERQRIEEEEKLRILEEAENLRLENLRLEHEKKDKKKQKEKERKERLKAEGKLLSNKQKLEKARAQAMLDALKAQGVDVPEVGEKRPRPGTRVRQQKKKEVSESRTESTSEEKSSESQLKDDDEKKEGEEEEVKPVVEEVVKDAWDASSSSEEEPEPEDELAEATPKTPSATSTAGGKAVVASSAKKTTVTPAVKKQKSAEDSDSDSSSEGGSDDGDDSDENSDEEARHLDAERRKQRVRERIDKRQYDAEQKRTLENLRAAVVCVLGHVDTGKTKILDKLRRTNVQDGEAGGITQQIGATNVPIDAIKEQTRIVKNSSEMVYKLPGLLIIDTPGHESFSNLRNRGSSLCDIAILVVDIMHGLEPQTIESLNLLKAKKTPFLVALNKIDRLYDWQTMNKKDIRDVIKGQQANTQLEFTQRTKDVILQFAEQGLNAALFYENPDPRSYVSLVPTSAITGEGMGNLLYLIVEACQTHLAKRLMYCEHLLATVLEVKAIPGLGTTIDAILINGKLREGETMIVAGTDGPIVTQIRSLLMPQPMKELRVKNAYIEHKEIRAAQGVKIAAKELEKAIAGLNLQIAQKPDEVEIYKEEVARELKSALSGIKLSALGVYVQASTLGSLEALLEFLKSSKIPYAGIRIGPVVKRDVMKASTMLEHEAQFATILAFDVKIERDAQDMADSLGVKIFQADIIYHLFDKFMAYRDELKAKKRDEFKSIAVFPCKLKILPQFIFNSRDPIVMGVMVEAGIVKEGTPICVPTKEFVELGIITSLESNHKQVETARKGQEICIKIEPIPGEAPKMFGRHFEETDMLVSKISRQSIDACKEYFRDDLVKADWALMVELKKQFQIL